MAGVGMRFNENKEYIKKFELDKYFNGKASNIAPVAKWIIHCHNNDVRELHYHLISSIS